VHKAVEITVFVDERNRNRAEKKERKNSSTRHVRYF